MEKSIKVTQSSMPPFEEYCAEIQSLWDSRWLTNMGEKHRQLEAALRQYLGAARIKLFTNGHLALETALAAFGFPAGSEVITTPFTFASTTQAIVRAGLIPVFCDVEPETWTLDPQKLEPLITEKTAAVLPVHVYGNFCDVDGIKQVAGRYKLKVIYDAAHTFGANYYGSSAAAFGDAAMFSFHATKVFHTIEGGAVCFSDIALAEPLECLKNFGQDSSGDCPYIGGNAKMSEFQAAMGLCSLRHLEGELAKRKTAAERYWKLLGGVEGIRFMKLRPGVTPNYAYFPILFDGVRFNRDEICERLKGRGIMARKYFYPLTSCFTCCQRLFSTGAELTPVAAGVAENVLTLPLYAGLSVDEVDQICGIILK